MAHELTKALFEEINAHLAEKGLLMREGEESHAFGDAGYRGVDKREEAHGPKWSIAMLPGKRRRLTASALGQMLERVEKIKASIRAKVEHPFHVVKNLFRHRQARYKGLAKNDAQLFTLFGLANLVIAKKRLLAT